MATQTLNLMDMEGFHSPESFPEFLPVWYALVYVTNSECAHLTLYQDKIKAKRLRVRRGIEGDFMGGVADIKTRITKHYDTETAKRYVRGSECASFNLQWRITS